MEVMCKYLIKYAHWVLIKLFKKQPICVLKTWNEIRKLILATAFFSLFFLLFITIRRDRFIFFLKQLTHFTAALIYAAQV